jgi:predicted metalloprotease with PDZ domain
VFRRRLPVLALALAALALPAGAQDPLHSYSEAFEQRLDRSQPRLSYDVRVDPADYGAYAVTLTVRNSPETLRLRLPIWAPGAYRVANFARNLRDLTVAVNGTAVPVSREDSSAWTASVPRGATVLVRYTIRHPSATAASTPNNRSFLRADGGLFDGPQTFVYLDGHKLVPSHVHFSLPAGWKIATGLVPTADAATFAAPSYDVLIDSPALVGPTLRSWPFVVDGVPHRAAYFALPGATPFDTSAFTQVVKRLVETERDAMGSLPYRDYTFLFVDGTGGGLEHLNSTTIGVNGEELARDAAASADVTAHEFFHLWNIKRIRPAVLGPFDYQRPVRTTDLWWSEGVTDYFAQEFIRRTGLRTETAARDTLAALLETYLANPAHTRISPERSSWTAWDTPMANGGYGISYYTQGAVLGELLELELRDRTDFRRGMDDVERMLFDRFAGPRGFTGEDLLHTVNEVCGCDLESFFAHHVSGAEELDLEHSLALLGWRAQVGRAPARDSAGRALPDRRMGVSAYGGYGSAGGAAGAPLRISVSDPTSAWGRAGLVTGDELATVNGRHIASAAQLKTALAALRMGDQATVEVVRAGVPVSARVSVAGYERTTVSIVDLPVVTPRMRRMREIWLTGR